MSGEQEILLREYAEILETLRFTMSQLYVAFNVFLVANTALVTGVSYVLFSNMFSTAKLFGKDARPIYVFAMALVGALTSFGSIIVGYRMSLYVIAISDRGLGIEGTIPVKLISVVRTVWDSGSGVLDALNVGYALVTFIGAGWALLAWSQRRGIWPPKRRSGSGPVSN